MGRVTSPRPPLPMGHGDGPRKGQSGKSTHVHGGKHVNRGGAFKAHRNVKRAVRDVDAENALRSRACAGVCRRCVQKVRASRRVASQPIPTSPPPRRVEKHPPPDPSLPRAGPVEVSVRQVQGEGAQQQGQLRGVQAQDGGVRVPVAVR